MRTFKFLLSSLFSNKRIINEGNEHPFWLALIIFLISLVIAVVPMTVSIMGQNGSDIIVSAQNYSLDMTLKKLSSEYLYQGSETEANVKDHKLYFTNLTDGIWKGDIIINDDTALAVRYVSNTNDLDYVIKDVKTSYPKENDASKSKIPSMLIFTQDNMTLYIYDDTAESSFTKENGEITINSETSAVGSISGNFENVNDIVLNSFFNPDAGDQSKQYDNAYNGWIKFFDDSYSSLRNNAALITSLTFGGIDIAIILIFALVLFLLSKTKSSPIKLNYLQALKFDCFASLSPAIIGLLVGLIFPDIMYIGFIIIYGIRATFLGMKATSPARDDSQAIRK